MTVSSDAALCSLVGNDRCFRRPSCLLYQGDETLIALMIDAVSSSETSANIDQATKLNIPGDSNIHARRSDKLKSHQTTGLL